MEAAKFIEPTIIPKEVNDYVLSVGFNESGVAEELRFATAKLPASSMMGCPVEAAFFKFLLSAIGAKKILEIGVFTGYTTLVMAQSIGPSGKVIGLDINPDIVSKAQPYWEKAGVSKNIEMRFGPALESLEGILEEPGQKGSFDFVFIDADKANNLPYYEKSLELLRTNGIVAIDNTLWSGKVINPEIQDEDTVVIRELSEFLKGDERVEHVLLPFADGITVIRKL